MARSKIITFALLYSNSPLKDEYDHKLYNNIRETIQNDEILKKAIHLICIDNNHTRNLLQYNSSGLKIYNWPIFVVRNSEEKHARVYPLHLAPIVFDQVHKLNQTFQSNDKIRTLDWSLERFRSNPQHIQLNPGEKIRFLSHSNEVHDLVEATPDWNIATHPRFDFRNNQRTGFDQEILFDKPGFYHFISTCCPEIMKLRVDVIEPNNSNHDDKQFNNKFPWNLTAFPSNGIGRELTVEYGDQLYLVSTDNRTHNVTLSNGKIIVPDQIGLRENIFIDQQLFKPGLNEIFCTFYPERMKLRLYVNEVQSEPSELFDGMTLGSYDEPSNTMFRTFAQRQAARRNTNTNEILDGITDEY